MADSTVSRLSPCAITPAELRNLVRDTGNLVEDGAVLVESYLDRIGCVLHILYLSVMRGAERATS